MKPKTEPDETIYPVGAASLFANIARETTIPHFCEFCGVEWHMPLAYETEREEVYSCPGCGRTYSVTVR